mmetsp:Transcript_17041/g.25200  ORF Transcript_17041/g.25200 Transcript_17041/m.25200 type:complete len:86 (-) Transcript_17041:376-633(-)
MVLSEQAMRNWKVATYVCTFGTAFFTTFYVSYPMPPHLEGKKHVLTDIQKSYHEMIDRHFWGLPLSTNNNSKNRIKCDSPRAPRE